jgi:hypothetical protein
MTKEQAIENLMAAIYRVAFEDETVGKAIDDFGQIGLRVTDLILHAQVVAAPTADASPDNDEVFLRKMRFAPDLTGAGRGSK